MLKYYRRNLTRVLNFVFVFSFISVSHYPFGKSWRACQLFSNFYAIANSMKQYIKICSGSVRLKHKFQSQGRSVYSLPRDSARKLKVIGCDETSSPNDMR